MQPLEILKSQPKPHPDSPVVVSYGGGKNSTALLILCQRLEIKVDLILFADTGGELSETYEYIDMFSSWLVENGMPPIITVRRKPVSPSKNRAVWKEAKINLYSLINKPLTNELLTYLIWWVGVTGHKYETLEENCLVTNTLPSKAYGHSSCSLTWKVDPQDKYVNNWKPAIEAWNKGLKVRKLIGYHVSEIPRLIDKKTKQMRDLEDDKYRYEYPLMAIGLDDEACQTLIKIAGLPVPPKSSCFFCPHRKLPEIRELPEELRFRGELIEAVAKGGIHWKDDTSVKGLGRKFAWSDIEDLSDSEQALIGMSQLSRTCGCVD